MSLRPAWDSWDPFSSQNPERSKQQEAQEEKKDLRWNCVGNGDLSSVGQIGVPFSHIKIIQSVPQAPVVYAANVFNSLWTLNHLSSVFSLGPC